MRQAQGVDARDLTGGMPVGAARPSSSPSPVRSSLRVVAPLLLRRGLVLWLAVRALVTTFVLLFGLLQGGEPESILRALFPLPLDTLAFELLAFAALVLIELARRRERVLFANLGVARRQIVAVMLLVPLAGELLVWVATGLRARG